MSPAELSRWQRVSRELAGSSPAPGSDTATDPATDPDTAAGHHQSGIITDRQVRRLAMAHDASHYLLVPEAVATPRSGREVAALLRACDRAGLPVTFRSGGSSLSGQAGTEHLLVDTRHAFRSVTVLDDGRRVRAQPGTTLALVNAHLAPYGTRLGPDPASETACTIGGLVTNNSSGMTCGTELNTYRTLDSAVLVLPSGTVLDTADDDADAQLRAREPHLHAELLRLRDRVRENADSVRRIRSQFAMKNTMGYGINALLDFDTPAEILLRLVVGSEGTLAFVAEATFRTVPVEPLVSTSLLVFPDLAGAMTGLAEVRATDAAVVELLDRTSLTVCQRDPRSEAQLGDLEVADHAALLVEHRAHDDDALAAGVEALRSRTGGFELARPFAVADGAKERADLWALRKGLYAAVAGHRPAGTNALLEDVAVPGESMLELCTGLLGMFEAHEYPDAAVFGHARDGNLHFLLNERFDDAAGLRRYETFTDELVDLVLGLGGTLKAEHGTGRVMAPYVRRQYGDELYSVMRQIKEAVDPGGVLNPGVVINDDPRAHIRHLKTNPRVEEEVDRCVECGYCEPVCPSRDLTLTPRQRIVLRRHVARLREEGRDAEARELEDSARYELVDTCAVDGMCATACPVHIDTGALVRRLRTERTGPLVDRVGGVAAEKWGAVTRAGGLALDVAARAPGAAEVASRAARALAGPEAVPGYDRRLPGGGGPRPEQDDPGAEVVVFPSCVGSVFGPAGDSAGSGPSLLALCERAGIAVRTPDGLSGLCCGMPWSSKGLSAGRDSMTARVARALWRATDAGRLPVVADAASCTEGLVQAVGAAAGEGRAVEVVDSVRFVRERVVPVLRSAGLLDSPRWRTLVLHPTCSTTRAGLDEDLRALAGVVAERVVIPVEWACCGFAGDRGLLHPELTESATRPEVAGVPLDADVYASANRTCELAMSMASGREYVHVIELLEQATRG